MSSYLFWLYTVDVWQHDMYSWIIFKLHDVYTEWNIQAMFVCLFVVAASFHQIDPHIYLVCLGRLLQVWLRRKSSSWQSSESEVNKKKSYFEVCVPRKTKKQHLLNPFKSSQTRRSTSERGCFSLWKLDISEIPHEVFQPAATNYNYYNLWLLLTLHNTMKKKEKKKSKSLLKRPFRIYTP